MDIKELRELAGDLFTAGSTLAGLILVFLGGILSAYDSFSRDARFAVRAGYRKRGGLALGGFFAALVSAALALGAKWWALPTLLYSAAAGLALAFILTIILAVDAFGGLS